jgi:RHS repeat-associated protein
MNNSMKKQGRNVVAKKLFGVWMLLAACVGMGSVQAQTVEYIHTDALGTPVAVTDVNRNVIERSEYEPYGALLNRPISDGPGYTGHVMDAATGLTYMQQRYYDPQIGRFLSVDPVTADGNTGGNFNRYWYANNNPLTNTDPDGRKCHKGKVECLPESMEVRLSSETKRKIGKIAEAIDQFDHDVISAFGPPAGPEHAVAVPVVALFRVVAADSKVIRLSMKAQGEAALHARDAIAAGKPNVLTIARDGAGANRSASTGGIPKVPGRQLDEYPPAMFKEGGAGASVRAINSSHNMSAGACIGNACRGLPNGTQVRIEIEE